MKKDKQVIAVRLLEPNTGQLDWLPRNPRQWTREDVARTAQSIEEDPDFLEDRPLLVVPHGKKWVVFAGNLRREGCLNAGLESVPCVTYQPEDDADQLTIKRRAMKDNGSFGSWDYDELANAWDDLPLEDWGIEVPEMEVEEEEKEAVEDNFNEEQEEIHVRCKLGDVWQLGEHRLMCGDSTDLETVKKLMGGGEIKADISFFSPPYNTGGLGKNITKDNGRSKYINNADDMGEAEYTDFLNSSLNVAMELSKYTFLNVQMLANNKRSIVDVMTENRDHLADVVIWDKGRSQPALAASVLNSEFEFVFIFSESATRAIGTIPFRGNLKNIVHITPGHNDFAEIHNAVFPIEFPAHFISNFAKESVLDLFGGTGTTMIAAEQLGRRCYMMELDPHYCDVIIARWEKLTGKEAVKIN